LLRKLLGELEGALWRHARLQGIEGATWAELLRRGHHSHVHVLLLSSLDLLLLLLQQLNLLLDS